MTTVNKQLHSKLSNILVEIGFSVNEALVYMANLSLGPASIWDISKLSGVKRTTCYLVMNDLITAGYASFSQDTKHLTYAVISPNDLFLNHLNRQAALKWAMPELNAMASKSIAKPSTRMFEGVEGVQQAYQITLAMPEGSEILIYGNPEVYINYPKMVEQYVRHRVEKMISVRTIIPDVVVGKEVTRDDERILRVTRVLPKDKFNQRTEVNILPDRIIYIAHSEKIPFATVIESAPLAMEERNRFELLWELARPISETST